jgi:hypothetical protein
MLDFTQNELYTRAVLAERRRETSKFRQSPRPEASPHCLRAWVAARLAALALAFDREVARRRIEVDVQTRAHHGV